MAPRKTTNGTPRATTRRTTTKRPAAPKPAAAAAEGEETPAAKTKVAAAKVPAAPKTSAKAPTPKPAAKAATAKTPAAAKPAAAPKAATAKPAAKPRAAPRAKPAAPAPAPSLAARVEAAPTVVKAAGVAGLAAAIGGAVVGLLRIFRRPAREGTVPTDLMGAEHPDGSTRAIEDFRPDPTAPVPASEREALRPALGKPTLVGGQPDNLPGSPSRH